MKRSLRKRTRGAAVVEAAIVLPVVVLLTFGIIELGCYVNNLHILHNAARQGARAAVHLENSNAEVELAVITSLNNAVDVDPNALTVRISKLNDLGDEEYQVQNLNENEEGEAIRVTATVVYAAMRPISNMLGLASESLTSSATMQRRD